MFLFLFVQSLFLNVVIYSWTAPIAAGVVPSSAIIRWANYTSRLSGLNETVPFPRTKIQDMVVVLLQVGINFLFVIFIFIFVLIEDEYFYVL